MLLLHFHEHAIREPAHDQDDKCNDEKEDEKDAENDGLCARDFEV